MMRKDHLSIFQQDLHVFLHNPSLLKFLTVAFFNNAHLSLTAAVSAQ